MARAIERWLKLTPHERRLVVEAWRWLADARLRLWLRSFAHIQRSLASSHPTKDSRPGSLAAGPEAVAAAVRRARRLVPSATCLPQALAVRSMLVRRGVAHDLHIGVSRSDMGQLQAHAWVEVEGRVVIGDLPDLARFRHVASFQAPVPDGG